MKKTLLFLLIFLLISIGLFFYLQKQNNTKEKTKPITKEKFQEKKETLKKIEAPKKEEKIKKIEPPKQREEIQLKLNIENKERFLNYKNQKYDKPESLIKEKEEESSSLDFDVDVNKEKKEIEKVYLKIEKKF